MVILYEMLQFKNTLYGVVVGNPTLNSFILLQKNITNKSILKVTGGEMALKWRAKLALVFMKII